MKEEMKKSTETENTANPYPIYPDIDEKVKSQGGTVTMEEIVQDTDLINPDPSSLDRG